MTTVESKLKTFPEVLKNLHSMMTSKDTESTEIVDTTNLIAVVTDGCKPVRCYSLGEKLQTMTVQVPRVPQGMIKVAISNPINQVNKNQKNLFSGHNWRWGQFQCRLNVCFPQR